MEVDRNDETIEVRFVTQQEKWRVTDKPFRVPADLARIGLSGVINHLLNTGNKNIFLLDLTVLVREASSIRFSDRK